MKACPSCCTILPLGVSPCPQCGHEWAVVEMRVEHARVASALCPIDLSANRPKVRVVDRWWLRRHEKGEGLPVSMRVDYQCGMLAISEWVCFEHDGFAARKAGRWWIEHDGVFPVPTTVTEAMDRQGELSVPLAVEVVRDGEYDRVARSFFRQDQLPASLDPGQNQITA